MWVGLEEGELESIVHVVKFYTLGMACDSPCDRSHRKDGISSFLSDGQMNYISQTCLVCGITLTPSWLRL